MLTLLRLVPFWTRMQLHMSCTWPANPRKRWSDAVAVKPGTRTHKRCRKNMSARVAVRNSTLWQTASENPNRKLWRISFLSTKKVTETAYNAMLNEGWAWRPEGCSSCHGRLVRQTWKTCCCRGWGRLYLRCEDCGKWFDVLTFSYLITVRLPLTLVWKALTMHFQESPPPTASQVGRLLGMSATPGGRESSMCQSCKVVTLNPMTQRR